MPHIFSTLNGEHGEPELIKRDPKSTKAYLIGGGIASLTAAVHLIQDAQVPSKNIHIIEALALAGGSMDGSGNPEQGYIIRGGRMLNCSYVCTYDMLEHVPSLQDKDRTVMDDIRDFNSRWENKTHSRARLVATHEDRPEILDTSKMGFNTIERLDLIKMAMSSDKELGNKRIDECFPYAFFKTKFWYMWATTFAFQPWHSAVEFRRYLLRFMHEFPRLSTLVGVDRTPYNQYDSIILPIQKYLEEQGVNFYLNTRVTKIDFMEGVPDTVTEIHMDSNGTPLSARLDPQDIVIATLGCMTSDSSIGSNDSPPPTVIDDEKQDGSWDLWMQLAARHEKYGNPATFSNRINESKWESFTVTLKDPELIRRIEGFTRNDAGTGALMTFKDSNWLMSIVVPHQPHFIDQPYDVKVFWGYGLFPEKEGNFVMKPMSECTGQEILMELLSHLHFPFGNILENAIVRPCMMPYITSQFLTRAVSDRPKVIPEGTTNIALVGQFVEIPEDTVFTVEYSVRGAQMAVFELMGLDKKPKTIYKGDHHLGKLVVAMMKMMT